MTKKKSFPIRILIENLAAQRRLLESLDSLVPQIIDRKDRTRLWELRMEILDLLLKDADLKRGINWELM